MNYPSINEYIEAIRFAEDNFDQLKHLRPVLGGDGKPVMTSGNFAVVFQMKDEQTGKLHAVKCFLREQEGRAEAYRQIAEELEYVSSTFLTPIKYLDKELFVDTNAGDEKEFPVLLMDWVEGDTLDKYIRKHLDDQYELSLLAYQFSRLAMWLMPQPFAHGDLKPDNILVKNDGTLVLVDYDGMYVPAMKGQKARELGSPDFRHPNRTETDFDEHIDDFSLASILLSLKAISLQPELLEEYGASDRLLFSEKDYRNLSESAALIALRPLMLDIELATLQLIFVTSVCLKNLSQVSIRFIRLSKPDVSQYSVNEKELVIHGKIEVIAGMKYLLIYDENNIFDINNIEDKAIDGLRIIEFSNKKRKKRIIELIKGLNYKDYDNSYGLINEKDELVTPYDYFRLTRLDNGNISAIYPDPMENGGRNWGKERFSFIMNSKGQPLFKYSIKEKDGTKSSMFCPLSNVDAVSSCFYGIALFVRNHKMGIVDYKGKILIKPIHNNIIIDVNNNFLTTGSTTYLFKKDGHWPLYLFKLDKNYFVESLFKYRGKAMYYLRNKRNSMRSICLYDGLNIVLSPEYISLSLLDYWYLSYKPDNNDALFIAVDSNGKYGIICMPTEPMDVNPETGDFVYNESQTICPFIFDYITGNEENYVYNVILIKDGKEGLFSCYERRILVDCVIPTIRQYNYAILPFSYGEGLIGCREEVDNNSLSPLNKYYFSDIEGNRVVELPLGWRITSGFENGVAQIQTGKYIIKTANIDRLGNLTITKEERAHIKDDSYDDIESMYRDAFEDDPNMEWNID